MVRLFCKKKKKNKKLFQISLWQQQIQKTDITGKLVTQLQNVFPESSSTRHSSSHREGVTYRGQNEQVFAFCETGKVPTDTKLELLIGTDSESKPQQSESKIKLLIFVGLSEHFSPLSRAFSRYLQSPIAKWRSDSALQSSSTAPNGWGEHSTIWNPNYFWAINKIQNWNTKKTIVSNLLQNLTMKKSKSMGKKD